MYILTTTAKRRNAKRHIAERNESIAKLEEIAKNYNHNIYIIEIYNGKWELVKEV